MGQSEYIAALDLGSSKIMAMVGSKNEQGILSVIASRKTESGSCIRRGCVHNVEETAEKIKNLIYELNQEVKPSIEKIYVGIGGQSLRTETYSVTQQINGTMVSESLLNSLYLECKSYQPEFAEVLDIVSPEYYLDDRLEINPKGIQCNKIEARYKLILGRPLLKKTLHKAIAEKARVEIAGYIVTPIATAEAVLTETEKELGCALVEFGAGITYVSVYKNNLLKYLIAVPLGGNVITKDICCLNLIEKDAEDLKIRFGSALTEFDKHAKAETAKLAEGMYGHREIKLNMLNNIIEARIEEIVANVIEQINLSGYADLLGSGIIITGGGASLNNLADFIRNKTNKNVRLASVRKTLVNHALDWAQDHSNAEIIGILSLGKENCAKIVVEKKENEYSTSLFGTEEMGTRQVSERGSRRLAGQEKEPDKKSGAKSSDDSQGKANRVGFFGKISKKFEGMSKSLFDEDDNEENDNLKH